MMVHWWQDPVVEASLAIVYVDVIFWLLGVYWYVFRSWRKACLTESLSSWEYLQSFGVEYAVIRGRLPFRWPLVSGGVSLVS